MFRIGFGYWLVLTVDWWLLTDSLEFGCDCGVFVSSVVDLELGDDAFGAGGDDCVVCILDG